MARADGGAAACGSREPGGRGWRQGAWAVAGSPLAWAPHAWPPGAGGSTEGVR